ncbi:hypothetical protein YC2023_057630 [Brassica napus]
MCIHFYHGIKLLILIYKFQDVYFDLEDQIVKKPKVAIGVLELLQCRDSEIDEVTTPKILLKRKGRDYEMNQRVGGDDKEDYDRSGLWRSRRRREVYAARALFI